MEQGNKANKSALLASANNNNTSNNNRTHSKRMLLCDDSATSKLYIMCQLNFYLVESEGIIMGDGAVEVRLLIDNHSDFDWPEQVHVKGREECAVTRGFDYVIPQRVKKCSVKGVKFTLACPVSLSKLEDEVAVFELYALDEAANMKYFSNEIRVSLKHKKSYSLFNLCSSFIK